VLLPVRTSKATAGCQGRSSGFSAVEGTAGETTRKAKSLPTSEKGGLLPSPESAPNCPN